MLQIINFNFFSLPCITLVKIIHPVCANLALFLSTVYCFNYVQHMLLSNFGMFVCDLELVAHYKMFFKTTTG